MISTLKLWKTAGISLAAAAGLTLFTGTAQARNRYSSEDVREAQQQLRASGYYRGPIDGRYHHRMTRALTDFQVDNNLAETGRLNHRTCERLSISCGNPR